MFQSVIHLFSPSFGLLPSAINQFALHPPSCTSGEVGPLPFPPLCIWGMWHATDPTHTHTHTHTHAHTLREAYPQRQTRTADVQNSISEGLTLKQLHWLYSSAERRFSGCNDELTDSQYCILNIWCSTLWTTWKNCTKSARNVLISLMTVLIFKRWGTVLQLSFHKLYNIG